MDSASARTSGDGDLTATQLAPITTCEVPYCVVVALFCALGMSFLVVVFVVAVGRWKVDTIIGVAFGGTRCSVWPTWQN